MAFLNPFYLWAFLGLAVPVAIHLWSRKEGRTIKVGSIKFFAESHSKQARNIKLHELWLLVLRMLALGLLVLILAGPLLTVDDSPTPLTYLVEPSLVHHEEIRRMLDTINPDIEVKLLASEFPAYSTHESVNTREIPDYWQLVPQMQQLKSDSIIIITPAYWAGFKGRRPQTDQRINWVQVIPDERIDAPILAIQKPESLEILSVYGDHTRLGAERQITPEKEGSINATAADSISIDHNGIPWNIPLIRADTIRVSLFHDEDLKGQMRYIRSSLHAISGYLDQPLRIRELSQDGRPGDQEDLVVWLSTSPLKGTGSPVLGWKPDSLATSLIVQQGKMNVHHLTRSLDSENMVEEYFPEQLFKLLRIHEELEKEISKYDRRVMPLDEITPLSGSMGQHIERGNSRDISMYFWMLLVILLIVERGLSAYRKQ